MASLPDYTALGERPAPVVQRRTPLIATYRPQSGFEDAPAQSLAEGSREMEQSAALALRAQEQHDAIRADDAFTQLRQKQIEMTFGQDGFANLKSSDAVNRPLMKEYGSSFDQAAADLSAGLDNDNQRQLFHRRAQVAGMQLREDIARHVAQQTTVYANDVLKSRVDTEVQAAASRWMTPDAATVPLLNIQNAVNNYAEHAGKPPEWVKDAMQKETSQVYKAIISQASAADPERARMYFDAYGKNLNAEDRAQLDYSIGVRERQYKARMQPVEAREDAERAMLRDPGAVKVGDDQQPQLTAKDVKANLGTWMANAEEQAEKRHPGDLVYRDMVVNQVRGYVSKFVAAEAAQQNAAVANLDGVLAGVNGATRPTTQDELFAHPGAHDAFMLLDGKQQMGIIARLEHNAAEARGEFKRSDPSVINGLRERIYLPDGNPNKLTSPAQLTQYATSINYTDLERLKKEIVESRDNPFLQYVNEKKRLAKAMLTQSMRPEVLAHPDLAQEAYSRYSDWLDDKIKQESAAGRDPHDLFRAGSKDYVMDPNRVASFMPTKAEISAMEARGLGKAAAPQKISSDAEFNALPSGSVFIGPDGKPRRKP